MKTIKIFPVLIFALLFMLVGCDWTGSGDIDEINVTEKTARLIEAENEFGFEVFQNVYDTEKEKEKIMISPLSVSLALAMTYNGAEGETKIAMENTLKVFGLSSEDINKSYHDLVEGLQSLDSKVVLEIANAIFYREGFNVLNDFITTNKHYYNAEISELDFGSPVALETINNWVYQNTNKKIETILDEITPLQVMFLLNAIYFKGIWQTEFDEKETEGLPFYPEIGGTVQAETMHRLNNLLYTSNNLFSAIQLPYGKGNFNMLVFLPETGHNLKEIVNKLDKNNWETWMESFQITENVDIKLPRFKYEYEIKLNDVLSEMGMEIAFSDGADFSGINPAKDLFIEFVKHKSFIEVNEEGTEAAAATAVAVSLTAVQEPPIVSFHVNRPFLFAITEKSTGAILFIGTVKNPT